VERLLAAEELRLSRAKAQPWPHGKPRKTPRDSTSRDQARRGARAASHNPRSAVLLARRSRDA
jgi:hypothetical protein